MRICLEASVERGDCKVIGLAPINLDMDTKVMNLIAAITSSVRQRLQGLTGGMTWAARSQVNVIVIPVRIAGNWCIYQVVRGSHTQSVMRQTDAPMTTNNKTKTPKPLFLSKFRLIII